MGGSMSGGRKFTLTVVGLSVLTLVAVGFYLKGVDASLWVPWFTAFVATITQYGVVNVGQKATAKDLPAVVEEKP